MANYVTGNCLSSYGAQCHLRGSTAFDRLPPGPAVRRRRMGGTGVAVAKRWILGAGLAALVASVGLSVWLGWAFFGFPQARTGMRVAVVPPSESAPAAGQESSLQRFVIVPGESSALYRVGETFFVGNRFNVAVGVTREIRGEILVDRRRPANSRIPSIRVDISRLTSDQSRRDQMIRERWLESSRFPIAEFRLLRIDGVPDTYEEGKPVPIRLHGELVVREVARPVTFEGAFVLDGDTLEGTARAAVRMTDFGFDPPSILGMLRAENDVEIEVNLVARRAD